MTLTRNRRAQWRLRLEKEYDDYGLWRLVPGAVLLVLLLVGTGWVLGGMKSPSVRYATQALELARLDSFGGRVRLERATLLHDHLKAFDQKAYNTLDVMGIALYVTGTQYKSADFKSILGRTDGRVRILILDPRMYRDAKTRPAFERIARYFGDSPDVMYLESALSALSLSKIRSRLGPDKDRFDVRLYQADVENAGARLSIPGRSYHRYNAGDPAERFDIVVPYHQADGQRLDSPLLPAYLIKNRVDDEDVRRQVSAFERYWKDAVPLDEALADLKQAAPGPDTGEDTRGSN